MVQRSRTVPVTVTIPLPLLDLIDEAAARQRLSRSAWIARAAEAAIERTASAKYVPPVPPAQ